MNNQSDLKPRGEIFKTAMLMVLLIILFALSLYMDNYTVRQLPDYRIYLYIFSGVIAFIIPFARQIAEFDRRINNKVYPDKQKDFVSLKEIYGLKYTAIALFSAIYLILLFTR
jgi:hypothetical protein